MKRTLTLFILMLISLFLLTRNAPEQREMVSERERTLRAEDHGAITIYLQIRYSDIYGGTYTSLEGEKYFLLTEATPELEAEIKGRSAYPDTLTIRQVRYSLKQLEEVKSKLSEAAVLLDLGGVGLDIENNRVLANTTTKPNAKVTNNILKGTDPGIIHWSVNKEKGKYEPLISAAKVQERSA